MKRASVDFTPRRSYFEKLVGAPGPSRTGTALRQPDFESGASTSSATGARAPDISGAPPRGKRFSRLILLGNDLDFDHGDAAIDDAECLRRRGGEVDDTALHERAAVVDAHDHRTVGVHIGDADMSSERQRWMRRRHGLRIHHFAVRGLGVIAVERCQPAERRGIGTFKNAAREEGGGKRKNGSCASHVDSMVIAPARPMVLSCMVSDGTIPPNRLLVNLGEAPFR